MPAKKRSAKHKKAKKAKRTQKRPSSRSRAPATRPYRVLALDGGGIRGLMTAVWLEALEKRLQRELGQSLTESFDLVAGTSTGSILACAISSGLSASEIRQMYVKEAAAIFPGRLSRIWSRLGRFFDEGLSAPKYDGLGLEAALRRLFGDLRFGELQIKPTLVTSYNTLTRCATVFKNTRERFADLCVWELTKASSAAPTYFAAQLLSVDGVEAPYIDGGLAANNPAACAIAEAIRDSGRPLSEIVVASFGTGESTRSISIKEAQEWGALEWAIPVIDVLMDGAADTTEYIVKQLLAPEHYFRFQTPLDDAYDDMDNADNTNLGALQNLALAYLRKREVKRGIERLTELLRS
ncbi:MAG: patatin [Planctomycetota bacterium]|nr:MAG: patatin [Planctomycetota bacterium]